MRTRRPISWSAAKAPADPGASRSRRSSWATPRPESHRPPATPALSRVASHRGRGTLVQQIMRGGMAARPEPFTLRVPDEAIADLRERLARTRFPDQAPGDAWAYGTDLGYLRQLVEYWRGAFDWRAEEGRLNAFPQF